MQQSTVSTFQAYSLCRATARNMLIIWAWFYLWDSCSHKVWPCPDTPRFLASNTKVVGSLLSSCYISFSKGTKISPGPAFPFQLSVRSVIWELILHWQKLELPRYTGSQDPVLNVALISIGNEIYQPRPNICSPLRPCEDAKLTANAVLLFHPKIPALCKAGCAKTFQALL